MPVKVKSPVGIKIADISIVGFVGGHFFVQDELFRTRGTPSNPIRVLTRSGTPKFFLVNGADLIGVRSRAAEGQDFVTALVED
jgi:hypothetical protein